MTMPWHQAALLLQGVPPRALVLAMTLAYALCFAGMLFAYLSYRRRQTRGDGGKKSEGKQAS